MRFEWTEQYKKDPRVTSDRVPPKWWLDELRALDPLLKVEWWNVGINNRIGPSYRLIRVLEDGRWVHVDWFKDTTMEYINWLKSIDQHKSSPEEDKARIYKELLEERERIEKQEAAKRNEDATLAAEDMVDALYRMKDRFYSYSK